MLFDIVLYIEWLMIVFKFKIRLPHTKKWKKCRRGNKLHTLIKCFNLWHIFAAFWLMMFSYFDSMRCFCIFIKRWCFITVISNQAWLLDYIGGTKSLTPGKAHLELGCPTGAVGGPRQLFLTLFWLFSYFFWIINLSIFNFFKNHRFRIENAKLRVKNVRSSSKNGQLRIEKF